MKTKFGFFPKKKVIKIEFKAENEDDKHFLTMVKEKMNYGRFISEISSSSTVEDECVRMDFLFRMPQKAEPALRLPR